MSHDTPKTTIYLQAIITTDAVPDFSFFNQLAKKELDNAKIRVAASESSPLLSKVKEETPAPRFPKHDGDNSKPVTEGQIKFVESLAKQGKYDLEKLLASYDVSDVSQLTHAQAQSIFDKYKNK